MHLGNATDGIVYGYDWPWPSRSFGTLTDKRTPKWDCPHDNSCIFDLESLNLAQICILGSFCFGLYMGSVDCDLQGNLGLLTDKRVPKWACPHDNSYHIGPWVTKFGTNMCLGKLLFAIVYGVSGPWPSRSFETLILGFFTQLGVRLSETWGCANLGFYLGN